MKMKKCPKCGKTYKDREEDCYYCRESLVSTPGEVVNTEKEEIGKPEYRYKIKKCPKCSKTYDDSWAVCLNCGISLCPGEESKESYEKRVEDRKRSSNSRVKKLIGYINRVAEKFKVGLIFNVVWIGVAVILLVRVLIDWFKKGSEGVNVITSLFESLFALLVMAVDGVSEYLREIGFLNISLVILGVFTFTVWELLRTVKTDISDKVEPKLDEIKLKLDGLEQPILLHTVDDVYDKVENFSDDVCDKIENLSIDINSVKDDLETVSKDIEDIKFDILNIKIHLNLT
jgi:uncharacterized protein YoxC